MVMNVPNDRIFILEIINAGTFFLKLLAQFLLKLLTQCSPDGTDTLHQLFRNQQRYGNSFHRDE